jgi:hypothetical protein
MFTIQRNDQRYGPYTSEQVRNYLATGSLLPTDLVCTNDNPRWAPLCDVFAAPPPPPLPLSTPAFVPRAHVQGGTLFAETERARVNVFALCTLCGIWAAWFLLPFLTFGFGPLQMANATYWDCLGLSNGAFRFAGVVAIMVPLAALKTQSGFVKCLYLLPLLQLGLSVVLGLAELGQMAKTVGDAARDSPILGAIANVGFQSAIQSASVDFGAYTLGAASFVLATQVFARQRAPQRSVL